MMLITSNSIIISLCVKMRNKMVLMQHGVSQSINGLFINCQQFDTVNETSRIVTLRTTKFVCAKKRV